MDTQDKGDHAEMRAAAVLKRLGWTVLLPWAEEQQYDIVAERDNTFVRIQVKSSIYKDGGIDFSCHCSQSAKGANSPTHYTNDDIDGIAVYNQQTDTCYWVPIEQTNKWRMRLNDKNPDSKNPAHDYVLEDAFQ